MTSADSPNISSSFILSLRGVWGVIAIVVLFRLYSPGRFVVSLYHLWNLKQKDALSSTLLLRYGVSSTLLKSSVERDPHAMTTSLGRTKFWRENLPRNVANEIPSSTSCTLFMKRSTYCCNKYCLGSVTINTCSTVATLVSTHIWSGINILVSNRIFVKSPFQNREKPSLHFSMSYAPQ